MDSPISEVNENEEAFVVGLNEVTDVGFNVVKDVVKDVGFNVGINVVKDEVKEYIVFDVMCEYDFGMTVNMFEYDFGLILNASEYEFGIIVSIFEIYSFLECVVYI